MTGRGKYKVDQWYDVPIKTRNRNKQQQGNKDSDSIVKFFVSNLPPKCSSKDLVAVLNGFGEIHGTYIARKYDKLGKRFGFVSFKKGRNMGDLENNLKDVWIGSYKLYIVLARFVDGVDLHSKRDPFWKPVTNNNDNEDPIHVDKQDDPAVLNVGSSVDAGRSFRDTLLNKEIVEEKVVVNVDDHSLPFSHWFHCSLVGRVNGLHDFTRLRSYVEDNFQIKCSIKYVGGLQVLLIFENKEEAKAVLEKEEQWKELFQSLAVWEGQDLESERIAWLKIYGVPLCISSLDVFDKIVSKFGTVIQNAQFPENGDDLSYAFGGVLCKRADRIQKQVALKWKEKTFSVFVEEDVEEWSPDCIVDTEDDVDVDNQDEELNSGADLENTGQHEHIVSSEQQRSDSGMQEVEPNLFSEGWKDGNSRRKKGGLVRKKADRSKSNSPSGVERPKKRIRDDNDPYDIDRFIFNVGDSVLSENRVAPSGSSDDVYRTPDLNGATVGFEEGEVQDDTNHVSEEVNGTMLMADVVGVINVEAFEAVLEKSIIEEGLQTGGK